MSVAKIKVVHVINSFTAGGAEAMLCSLLLRCDRDRFEPSAVALIDDLTVAGPVLDAGVPVATMGMRPGVPDPRGIARLLGHLRRARPDVVQTWMDHSNLIGGAAARIATRARVVWGVHHSHHVPGLAKRTTLLTVAACGRLSRQVPDRIICCSEHSSRLYAGHGFRPEDMTVIPNGFDTRRFRPDPDARSGVRRELGLGPDDTLVGLVARYDPLKDHENFLRAARLLVSRRPEARFVLCGSGVDAENAALVAEIESLRLSSRCHLLGHRQAVERLHAAFDVGTSSSLSEAFPLAVGESMASGVPCVVTDVGDSALLVGPTGRVVPPRDPEALAGAWDEVLSLPPEGRRRLGLAARRRVRDLFDLDAVASRYEAVYAGLTGHRRATRSDPAGGAGPAPGRLACPLPETRP